MVQERYAVYVYGGVSPGQYAEPFYRRVDRAPTARTLSVRRLYHLLDTVAAQGETNWQAALSHVAAQATAEEVIGAPIGGFPTARKKLTEIV